MQNGLVGWWPFCGNANDESGNGNDGTVNGATPTTDRFGNVNSAYAFDGENDYIHVTSPSLLLSTNYTFSAWFNIYTSLGAGDPQHYILDYRLYVNNLNKNTFFILDWNGFFYSISSSSGLIGVAIGIFKSLLIFFNA